MDEDIEEEIMQVHTTIEKETEAASSDDSVGFEELRTRHKRFSFEKLGLIVDRLKVRGMVFEPEPGRLSTV